jgi:hypothetical protein
MPLLMAPTQGLTRETNVTAADRNGTTITAGSTANTKGAFSAGQLIAATAQEAYGIFVEASAVSVAATATSYLLDIGIGPSGSETLIVPDINIGYAGVLTTNQHTRQRYFFPVYIPSGERVAARGAAETASDVAEVAVYVLEGPAPPPMYPVGTVKAYGVASASSRGTLVPAGNGAYGAWTQVASAETTSEAHRWWCVGMALGDQTVAVASMRLLSIGFGPSDPPTEIRQAIPFFGSSNEYMSPAARGAIFYAEVPSGSQLWAQLAGADTLSHDVVIYGMS